MNHKREVIARQRCELPSEHVSLRRLGQLKIQRVFTSFSICLMTFLPRSSAFAEVFGRIEHKFAELV